MEQKRDETLQQIVENSRDAIVYIEMVPNTESTSLLLRIYKKPPKNPKNVGAQGIGFFIARDLLVTNIHVIALAKSVAAEQLDSKETDLYTVDGVMAFDSKSDLVVLKVAEECPIPLNLGNSENVRDGDPVYTVIYADAKFKYIKGTIYGKDPIDRFHRIKMQLSPGNSGSPVLNNSGEVIGVADSVMYSLSDTTAASEFANATLSNTLYSLLEKVNEVESFDAWQKRPNIRAYVISLQGDIELEKEKYKKAVAKYDVALKLNSDLLITYLNRSAAKIKLDDYGGAITDCDAVLLLNPGMVQAYKNRAVAKILLNDPESALTDLNLLLQHYLDSVDPLHFYYLRANVKDSLGDLAGAIEDYTNVIQLDPENSETYIDRGKTRGNLAKSKAEQGEIEEAQKLYQEVIEDYTKAIQLDPEHLKSNFYRGNTRDDLGQSKADQGNVDEAQKLFQEAIEDFTNAIQLNTKDPVIYYNRGYTRDNLGQSKANQGDIIEAQKLFQEAIEDFTNAIQLDSKYVSAYYNRGYSNVNLGQSKANQGDMIEAQKLFQEAIEDYTKAIQLGPEDPEVYISRGNIKKALGQNEKADADYEKAKKLEAAG